MRSSRSANARQPAGRPSNGNRWTAAWVPWVRRLADHLVDMRDLEVLAGVEHADGLDVLACAGEQAPFYNPRAT